MHHEASLRAFLEADKKEGCCGAHSLAEFYATATRLPGSLRLSGEQVMLFLENILERLTVITLTADEYYDTLKEAALAGVVGGATYDALLGRCAMKGEAEEHLHMEPETFSTIFAGNRKATQDSIISRAIQVQAELILATL